MKLLTALWAGLAASTLVLAAAGCGQQPPTPAEPTAARDAVPDPAPREVPAEPPAPTPEPASPAPVRVEPPAPRAKAVVRSEPMAETRVHDVRPPAPEPPSPPPAPAPAIVKTVPSGTRVQLILMDGLSSETSQVGDTFRSRVAEDVRVDGSLAVPAGSIVHGEVREVVPMKKIGGTAKLAMSFSRLDVEAGLPVDITASLSEQGKSQTKKDAATIGGAAAGGAILGKLIGKGSKEALIGAVVGAGVGTAVAAKNKGEQVELPVGTEFTISLDQPVDVTLRR